MINKKISKEKIIEEYNIGPNFNFDKYNYLHTWLEDNFVTIFTKQKKLEILFILFVIKGEVRAINVLERQNIIRKMVL